MIISIFLDDKDIEQVREMNKLSKCVEIRMDTRILNVSMCCRPDLVIR
jgi:hypothetical protein